MATAKVNPARLDSEKPEETARRLILTCSKATLATLDRNRAGMPYASLVLVAPDADGRPLLLLSRLAEHTANLLADPRASLLLDGTEGFAEILTGPRLTLSGTVQMVEGAEKAAASEAYIARHPSSSFYAGFNDFAFWRFSSEAAHLVAGFGRIDWLKPQALLRHQG
jgi:putative heme iron utilization protein